MQNSWLWSHDGTFIFLSHMWRSGANLPSLVSQPSQPGREIGWLEPAVGRKFCLWGTAVRPGMHLLTSQPPEYARSWTALLVVFVSLVFKKWEKPQSWKYFSNKFRISITLTIKIMEENEALSEVQSASNKQARGCTSLPPTFPHRASHLL